MSLEDTDHQNKKTVWPIRIFNLVCVGVGVLSVLLCIGLLFAVRNMDDYYFVPHQCQALECQHQVKQAPDGRSYCAAFPPKDIKMAQVSISYVRFCQGIVAFCGVVGLACGLFTAIGGLLRSMGIKRLISERGGMRLSVAAFAGAVGLPFLALFFLWPYGIVPM